jgi:pyruvate-ferredoxin/flavodoxin oxidoreductase
MAMSYGNVYVARIAFGAKDAQTVKAFLEAEAYPGPSLIIAYAHCIAHGYDMAYGAEQQKLAVDSGVWPLYRFDPRRIEAGQPPLQLDCGEPKVSVAQYMKNENRFRMLERLGGDRAKKLGAAAQLEVSRRFRHYQQLATLTDAPKVADLAPAGAAAATAAPAPQKG